MPHHPDARNQRIVALWNGGMSMTAIGHVLGISRNVVAGALHRARRRGEAVESRGTPANIRGARQATQKSQRIPTRFPPTSHQAPAFPGPRLLADPHEPIGCRWIDGEVGGIWSYCRRPTLPGQAWCPGHRERVYRPRESKPAAPGRASSVSSRNQQSWRSSIVRDPVSGQP